MRTLVIGLAGLVLAGCGNDAESNAEQTYGSKPDSAAATAPETGNQVEAPQNGGQPTTSGPATPAPSGGDAPAGSSPSENQSRPMQSRQ